MSIIRTKKEQLVEEFHVEVYSSGRIKWDNLDAFVPKRAVDRAGLMNHLKRKLAGFREELGHRSLAA